MVNILGNLDIKYLTGATSDLVQLDVLRRLYEDGSIQGTQLRVGSEFTNGKPAVELLRTIDDELKIPFVVHGPFECHGVDLGMSLDESGDFEAYRKMTGKNDWHRYNMDAIKEANLILTSDYSMGNYVLLHPGYAQNSPQAMEKGIRKIRRGLYQAQRGHNLSIETIPSLVLDQDLKTVTHYGFGGTPQEMMQILQNGGIYAANVLLDFSHISIEANQMAERGDHFAERMRYEELVNGFLSCGLDINPYCHFTGHWDGLKDEHPGFVHENATDEKIGATIEAFRHIKQTSGSLTVVIEKKFDNIGHARKEIDKLRERYLNDV